MKVWQFHIIVDGVTEYVGPVKMPCRKYETLAEYICEKFPVIHLNDGRSFSLHHDYKRIRARAVKTDRNGSLILELES